MLTKQKTPNGAHDEPSLTAERSGGDVDCRLEGDWTTAGIAAVDKELRALEADRGMTRVRLDLSGVGRMDTAGAWVVHRTLNTLKANGIQVEISGAGEDEATLLDAVAEALEDGDELAREPKGRAIGNGLEAIGRGVYRILGDAKLGMHILGSTIRGAQQIGRAHV